MVKVTLGLHHYYSYQYNDNSDNAFDFIIACSNAHVV